VDHAVVARAATHHQVGGHARRFGHQQARRLVARGEVEIVQSGRVVDPSTAKGPIRIRRVR
jgi:hypothetical protein